MEMKHMSQQPLAWNSVSDSWFFLIFSDKHFFNTFIHDIHTVDLLLLVLHETEVEIWKSSMPFSNGSLCQIARSSHRFWVGVIVFVKIWTNDHFGGVPQQPSVIICTRMVNWTVSNDYIESVSLMINIYMICHHLWISH